MPHSHDDAIFCPSSHLQVLRAAVLVNDQAVIPRCLEWVRKALGKRRHHSLKDLHYILPSFAFQKGPEPHSKDSAIQVKSLDVKLQTSFLADAPAACADKFYP